MDLTPLVNATARLREGLARYQSDPADTQIREGLLLSAWPVWRGFRELRGKTSHTYDEAIALEVVARIPAFLAEAEHLLQRLRERQAEG